MTTATRGHTIDEAERGTVLAAFARALGQESHAPRERPEILWQQPHNRLQWNDHPPSGVLEAERVQRTRLGGSPWLRMRTPFRESSAFVRTLVRHAASVSGCAISPDGRLLVSASVDSTLKVWDMPRGVLLRTLEGLIASASNDSTLKPSHTAHKPHSIIEELNDLLLLFTPVTAHLPYRQLPRFLDTKPVRVSPAPPPAHPRLPAFTIVNPADSTISG